MHGNPNNFESSYYSKKNIQMSVKWNVTKMPSQVGRIILVTGANSGLGFGTSKELARKGAKVIMAARNMDKGKNAMAAIRKEVPDADLVLMPLDLADLNSIKQFAESFKNQFSKLDVLINNAGVMMPNTRQTTSEGFELQFGTNHIGHFALTKYMLPFLKNTPNSRIVTLSSLVAKMGKADIYWNDLQWEKSYDKMAAYAQSKLGNMMFGIELQKQLSESGSHTISVLAHPGYTATNLQKTMGLLGKVMNFLLAQRLEMGILPTLRAATDPDVKGGEYYGPAKMGNWRGHPVINEPNQVALDRNTTRKLWHISEELSKIEFSVN